MIYHSKYPKLGNEFIHTHILPNLTLRINILESQTNLDLFIFQDTQFNTLIQSTYLIPSRLVLFQYLEYQSLILDESTYPVAYRLTKLFVDFSVDWTV